MWIVTLGVLLTLYTVGVVVCGAVELGFRVYKNREKLKTLLK